MAPPLCMQTLRANSSASSYRHSWYLQTCVIVLETRLALRFRPSAKCAAQIHELAEVISIVIRKKKRFPQNGLPLTMRYFGEEVGARTSHQMDHLLQIALERRHAFGPRLFIGGRWRFWPVPARKSGRDMFGITAEVQNVPLRKPRVFEQLPARVRQCVSESSIFPGGEPFQCVHEMDVRASAF